MIKDFKYILLFFFILNLSVAFAEKTNSQIDVSSNNLTNSFDAGKTFSYAPGHFEFLLPHYWEVIPEKNVQQYKDILKKMYPNKPTLELCRNSMLWIDRTELCPRNSKKSSVEFFYAIRSY